MQCCRRRLADNWNGGHSAKYVLNIRDEPPSSMLTARRQLRNRYRAVYLDPIESDKHQLEKRDAACQMNARNKTPDFNWMLCTRTKTK